MNNDRDSRFFAPGRRIPLALAAVFLVTIVMTVWWQVLFRRLLRDHRETRMKEVALDLRQAAADTALRGNLLSSGRYHLVSACGNTPCRQLPEGGAIALKAEVFRDISSQEGRMLNAFYWEAGFLILTLTSASAWLGVTLRRQREENRRRLEFIAMATHELKRPLAGASLVLQSLKRGTLPADQRDHFIGRGLKEIEKMDRQMGRLMKLEEWEISDPQPSDPYSAADLLKECIDSTAGGEKIIFRGSADADITVNRSALSTALLNLLENAVNYCRKSVEVEISSGDHLEIRIQDDGLGLTAEEMRKKGELFYRSARHAIQNISGSGIGLYMTERICSALRIKLAFYSEGENRGTLVVLTLP